MFNCFPMIRYDKGGGGMGQRSRVQHIPEPSLCGNPDPESGTVREISGISRISGTIMILMFLQHSYLHTLNLTICDIICMQIATLTIQLIKTIT